MKTLKELYEQTELNEATYKELTKQLDKLDKYTKISILNFIVGYYSQDAKFLNTLREAINTFA